MYCLPDAHVGSAPAKIAVHGFVDLFVGRLGMFREQCRSRHDLSRLAVAALRNVYIPPGLLQRMCAVRRKTFNGENARVGCGRYGRESRTNGLAVQVHRASAALTDSTAVFCSVQVEHIANDPKQWCVAGYIDGGGVSVHDQFSRHGVNSNCTPICPTGGALYRAGGQFTMRIAGMNSRAD